MRRQSVFCLVLAALPAFAATPAPQLAAPSKPGAPTAAPAGAQAPRPVMPEILGVPLVGDCVQVTDALKKRGLQLDRSRSHRGHAEFSVASPPAAPWAAAKHVKLACDPATQRPLRLEIEVAGAPTEIAALSTALETRYGPKTGKLWLLASGYTASMSATPTGALVVYAGAPPKAAAAASPTTPPMPVTKDSPPAEAKLAGQPGAKVPAKPGAKESAGAPPARHQGPKDMGMVFGIALNESCADFNAGLRGAGLRDVTDRMAGPLPPGADKALGAKPAAGAAPASKPPAMPREVRPQTQYTAVKLAPGPYAKAKDVRVYCLGEPLEVSMVEIVLPKEGTDLAKQRREMQQVVGPHFVAKGQVNPWRGDVFTRKDDVVIAYRRTEAQPTQAATRPALQPVSAKPPAPAAPAAKPKS